MHFPLRRYFVNLTPGSYCAFVIGQSPSLDSQHHGHLRKGVCDDAIAEQDWDIPDHNGVIDAHLATGWDWCKNIQNSRWIQMESIWYVSVTFCMVYLDFRNSYYHSRHIKYDDVEDLVVL